MYKSRYDFHKASTELISRTKNFVLPYLPEKVKQAQSRYIMNNLEIYSASEQSYIEYFLDTTLYKLHFATYSLEQLWVVHDAKIFANIPDIINNSIDKLDLSENEVFFQSYTLEQFLFQGRAFLDFYMLYLQHFLRTGYEGNISRKKFNKHILNAQPQVLNDKAHKVKDYFDNKVFSEVTAIDILSPTNWGTLLKSLRDKIAHRDKIKLSNKSNRRIMNDILLDFPTLQGLTYDSFCQAMQNGMFNLFQDLCPILYDSEWKAGKYQDGM